MSKYLTPEEIKDFLEFLELKKIAKKKAAEMGGLKKDAFFKQIRNGRVIRVFARTVILEAKKIALAGFEKVDRI